MNFSAFITSSFQRHSLAARQPRSASRPFTRFRGRDICYSIPAYFVLPLRSCVTGRRFQPRDGLRLHRITHAAAYCAGLMISESAIADMPRLHDHAASRAEKMDARLYFSRCVSPRRRAAGVSLGAMRQYFHASTDNIIIYLRRDAAFVAYTTRFAIYFGSGYAGRAGGRRCCR